MTRNILSGHAPALLTLGLLLAPAALAAAPIPFATGLLGPIKIDATAQGTLLVSERGGGANDGRLSLVDRQGNSRALLSGLPSGFGVEQMVSGPTGVDVAGCCSLYLAIGEGDTLRFDPDTGPPRQVPNPVGPVSPLFSTVLRVTTQYPLDDTMGDFVLSSADHRILADGYPVTLDNGHGEHMRIRMVADTKDFSPDAFTNVRASQPFGLTRRGNQQLIADAGGNSVLAVGPYGPPRTLLRFPPVANPAGTFPPFSDPVPTSIRPAGGNDYLVTLLVGVPFAPGTASVRLVNVKDRTQTELVSGLTSTMDTLRLGGQLYVLELSANLGQGLPGRLVRITGPSTPVEVVADGLAGPSSMVYVPRQRAVFVTETFANRVSRVPL